MRRTVFFGMAVAVVVAVMAMPGASQTQPPRTQDEWKQEAWSGSGTGRGGSSGSVGIVGSSDFSMDAGQARQRIMQMQQEMERRQREAEENRNRVIRELLGADTAQWRRIKPIMDKIEGLKEQINASIDPAPVNTSSNFFFTSDGNGTQWSGGRSMSFSGGGGMGASGGPRGTRTWRRSWSTGMPQGQRSSSGQASETDILCQELLTMLQNPNTQAVQISRKVMALRQAKERARTQLRQQQNRLRKQIKPKQEPALIVMGYLD